LFTVISLILIIILDQSVSVRDIAANIVEISEIRGVAEDDVIRNSLDGFLWRANGVEGL